MYLIMLQDFFLKLKGKVVSHHILFMKIILINKFTFLPNCELAVELDKQILLDHYASKHAF